MTAITADLNRQSHGGTVVVSLRRFPTLPDINQRFVLIDGEDQFPAVVTSLELQQRQVILKLL